MPYSLGGGEVLLPLIDLKVLVLQAVEWSCGGVQDRAMVGQPQFCLIQNSQVNAATLVGRTGKS